MSYGGSVADMISKIQQNRALLHVNKEKKELLKSVMLTNFHVKKYKHELRKEELTEEQKAIIMKNIIADIEKSERILSFTRAPLVILLIALVVISLWLAHSY